MPDQRRAACPPLRRLIDPIVQLQSTSAKIKAYTREQVPRNVYDKIRPANSRPRFRTSAKHPPWFLLPQNGENRKYAERRHIAARPEVGRHAPVGEHVWIVDDGNQHRLVEGRGSSRHTRLHRS